MLRAVRWCTPAYQHRAPYARMRAAAGQPSSLRQAALGGSIVGGGQHRHCPADGLPQGGHEAQPGEDLQAGGRGTGRPCQPATRHMALQAAVAHGRPLRLARVTATQQARTLRPLRKTCSVFSPCQLPAPPRAAPGPCGGLGRRIAWSLQPLACAAPGAARAAGAASAGAGRGSGGGACQGVSEGAAGRAGGRLHEAALRLPAALHWHAVEGMAAGAAAARSLLAERGQRCKQQSIKSRPHMLDILLLLLVGAGSGVRVAGVSEKVALLPAKRGGHGGAGGGAGE